MSLLHGGDQLNEDFVAVLQCTLSTTLLTKVGYVGYLNPFEDKIRIFLLLYAYCDTAVNHEVLDYLEGYEVLLHDYEGYHQSKSMKRDCCGRGEEFQLIPYFSDWQLIR